MICEAGELAGSGQGRGRIETRRGRAEIRRVRAETRLGTSRTMSNTMKALLAAAVLMLVGAVGASMLGVISLPIGPLNGMLAGEDELPTDAPVPVDAPIDAPGTGPGAAVPGTVPGAAVPGAAVPGAAVPGAAVPGAASPGAGIPGGGAPGAVTPAGSVPGAAVPGGVAPGTPAGPPRSTTDATNRGNSPEALRIAAEIAGVLQAAAIVAGVDATLLPAAGGVGPAPAVTRYRRTVTAAVVRITLTDPTSLTQWTSATRATRTKLVRGFQQRLKRTYPASARSVSVVDSSGTLLAVGDAVPRAAGTVKLY